MDTFTPTVHSFVNLNESIAKEEVKPVQGTKWECFNLNPMNLTVLNVTREEHYVGVQTTWLREDPIYYRLYCVGLNTLFATLIPLVTLFFFNVSTVRALKNWGKEDVSISDVSKMSKKLQKKKLNYLRKVDFN